METDGSGTYWATNSSGKVVRISDDARIVYDACRSLVIANGGGMILFRKGVYVFSTTLVLVDNIIIRGEDPENTIIQLDEDLGYTNIISGISVENVTISDISIRLRSDKASTGIHLSDSIQGIPRNIRIDHVYFYGGNPSGNGEVGIFLRGAENVVVTESIFRDVQGIIKCLYCNSTIVSDNVIRGSQGTRQLLSAINSDGLLFSDNDVTGTIQSNNETLIEIASSTNTAFRDNEFKKTYGVLLELSSNTQGVAFHDNNVLMMCDELTACNYIVINESNTVYFTGNKFSSNLLNYVASEEWVKIHGSSNINIESNHFQLSSYNAASTVAVNLSASSEVFIANNRVEGGPVVYTDENCSGITVTNNMVSSQNLYAPGSNETVMLSPSDDDENYLYDYQGTIYLEDKPLTATCVIETDGNGKYWALTSRGKIIESNNMRRVYDECRSIIVEEGGGKIFFRKGTYTLPATIMLENNMVLQGEGVDNTIIELSRYSGAIYVIAGIDVRDVTISDLKIVLRTNMRTTGILIRGINTYASHVRISNVKITVAGAQARSIGIYLNHVWKIDIKDVEIIGWNLTQINCYECNRVVIEDNYLYGGSRSSNAINISNSDYVAVKNNNIAYFKADEAYYNSTINVVDSRNIDLFGNNLAFIYNGVLYIGSSANTYFNENRVSVYCSSDTGSCPNLIVVYFANNTSISNNILKAFTSRQYIMRFRWIGVLQSRNVLISGNDVFSSGNEIISITQSRQVTINSNNMYSINVLSTNPAVRLTGVNDVRVLNNVIETPGTDIFYVTCILRNIVLSNNVLVGNNLLTPDSWSQCILSPSDSSLNYLRNNP